MHKHSLLNRTVLSRLALLCLLFCSGCSVKFTRVQQPPSLKGSAEIATFDTPSYPARSVQELLPEHIRGFDGFYEDRLADVTVSFVLTYQSRWYDYQWESVLSGLMWQRVIDPATGRVYIEALRGPLLAISMNRKVGQLTGRRHSGPDTLTVIRLKDGFQPGWREINGTAYQTHTYRGYMAVSTQPFVTTIRNANGSESIGFRDRNGWAMIPIEITLCADLTATARFLERQQRGRLEVTPQQNPVPVDFTKRIEGND